MPRRAHLLALVAASCVSCDRVLDQTREKPAPPPPSEKVPSAPGPDNTIKEMAPSGDPQPPSPIKADKPKPPPVEKPGSK
jgi:hypothetical protein